MPLTPATAPPPSPLAWALPRRGTFWGEDYEVVSVIGDGALTGGMAYEALNNAAR